MVDWGKALDRLSPLITLEEQEGVKRASVETGEPGHLRNLYLHSAELLVKYNIATWHQLRTSFPGTLLALYISKFQARSREGGGSAVYSKQHLAH